MIPVGLRIDVDTLRGTRTGVPSLIKLLARRNIRATFFFSVGPDNMGRHLWRLARPAFLVKMFRTRAPSLYGWDVLLRGTLWPGPMIGTTCADIIRGAGKAGHEIGLHAWDHHRWQTCAERMDESSVVQETQRALDMLTDILGESPACAAAPAWRTTPAALIARDLFSFRFCSDCRGHGLFHPLVAGRQLGHVQVPVTLPTYDELIGARCSRDTYNDYLLDLIVPDRLNVLTIHAEAEGIACLPLFAAFLDQARRRDVVFTALGDLLPESGDLPASGIVKGCVDGRDGWVAYQADG